MPHLLDAFFKCFGQQASGGSPPATHLSNSAQFGTWEASGASTGGPPRFGTPTFAAASWIGDARLWPGGGVGGTLACECSGTADAARIK
mmetsp:Transcript_44377/g.127107  ORF Transcript_44377/g.127107 Transcript_44377/m.127107 type:complete len:89 (-) Transcript_44377:97-363(-)